MNGFGRADLIIEAVAERLEVKQSVFQQLAEQVREPLLRSSNGPATHSGSTLAAVPPLPVRMNSR